MPFHFPKLDGETRAIMLDEINGARETGQIYFSTRFNETGKEGWEGWLLEAAQLQNEHWLSFVLEDMVAMKDFEQKQKPKGGYTMAFVPHTASETLADGQFNRFYIAAICRRALEKGLNSVKIYRARERANPRPESVKLEGTSVDAKALLAQVRGLQTSLQCELLRPNSGLSVDY